MRYTNQILTHSKWKEKRQEIFERDNFTCCKCGQKKDHLVLHHISYEKGLMPWEYPNEYLQTLCTGCHAETHNKILPKTNWQLVEVYEVGDYGDEVCELCGHDLKYVFILYHSQYGYLKTGCDCADKLTQSTEFTEIYNDQIRLKNFLKRFDNLIEFFDGACLEGIFYKNILIYFDPDDYDEGNEVRITAYLDVRGNLKINKKPYTNIAEEKVSLYNSIKKGILDTFIENKTCLWETYKEIRNIISRKMDICHFSKENVITK